MVRFNLANERCPWRVVVSLSRNAASPAHRLFDAASPPRLPATQFERRRSRWSRRCSRSIQSAWRDHLLASAGDSDASRGLPGSRIGGNVMSDKGAEDRLPRDDGTSQSGRQALQPTTPRKMGPGGPADKLPLSSSQSRCSQPFAVFAANHCLRALSGRATPGQLVKNREQPIASGEKQRFVQGNDECAPSPKDVMRAPFTSAKRCIYCTSVVSDAAWHIVRPSEVWELNDHDDQ